MPRPIRFVILCLATLLVALPTRAQSGRQALEAEIHTTYTMPDGRQFASTGRYYRSASGQIREESGVAAIITDLKAGTIVLLNAETKEAYMAKVSLGKEPLNPADYPAPIVTGEATVDGRQVRKTHRSDPGGLSHEVWIADDLGLVVFSKLTSGSVTTARELRGVSLREPDPGLFRIPKDFVVRRVDADTDLDRLSATRRERTSPPRKRQ